MPITRADLPPEIQDILDTPAREGACFNEQPVCQPDRRVTAQLTNEPAPRMIRPWRIANARKGDLIMCPGGSGGMIGGLLSQIDPAQYFSHMGIMTADEVEIRQATAVGDRVEKFYQGSILGLEDAPTDGIQEKALRFLWPGTVTQSIEQAYNIWHGRAHQVGDSGLDVLGNKVLDPAWKVKDETTGEAFYVDSITLGPVHMNLRGEEATVFPIVVKPCPLLETSNVRAALHRVADAARDLRGHYRFFGYTRAEVGLDGRSYGPTMLEASRPDETSPCTGIRPEVPVRDGETVPMVCSTFVWLAVQLANERAVAASPPLPKIMLDGRPEFPHFNADGEYGSRMCRSYFSREPALDRIDDETADGLYFYGKAERGVAAQWLYDYEVAKVHATLDEKLPGLFASLGIGLAGDWSVKKFTEMLGTWSLGSLAALLGISAAQLEALIVLTTDMPDDLGNQICNAFAADRCETEAKDDDRWKLPGVGYTVSPDNIINSWAPPTPHEFEGPAIIHGLYGYNERVILRPPEFEWNPPPPSTWQISQADIPVEVGRVTFRGIGVHGAVARIGCNQIVTGPGGLFPKDTQLPSGHYWSIASYLDPKTGLLLESKGQPVLIGDFGAVAIEFELEEPRDTRREVFIEGKMDLVNRYAIGEDWWGHPIFVCEPAILGLDYFPDEEEFEEARKISTTQPREVSNQVDDWGQAQLLVILEIQDDKSVKVSYRSKLRKDDDDPWQVDDVVVVPPKKENGEPGREVAFDLVRSEMAWPVRAHVEFTIHNNRAS